MNICGEAGPDLFWTSQEKSKKHTHTHTHRRKTNAKFKRKTYSQSPQKILQLLRHTHTSITNTMKPGTETQKCIFSLRGRLLFPQMLSKHFAKKFQLLLKKWFLVAGNKIFVFFIACNEKRRNESEKDSEQTLRNPFRTEPVEKPCWTAGCSQQHQYDAVKDAADVAPHLTTPTLSSQLEMSIMLKKQRWPLHHPHRDGIERKNSEWPHQSLT